MAALEALPSVGTVTGAPLSEPAWVLGEASPYYTQAHEDFRKKVRAFVDAHIAPFVDEWDETGTYPRDIHRRAYEAGVYGAVWPREHGGTPPPGGELPDGSLCAFMDAIWMDELARCGSGGALAAVFIACCIAVPPILSVGSQALKERVARPCIRGDKIICLAITEPWAGSDVAALRTTAVRAGDGSGDFILSGEKKFITSGMKADFFVVACRTGGKGIGGISLLLVERERPGIECRRMKTQGWLASNTAYIVFDDVRVPASNMIGAENQGFLPIMLQFNHERLVGCVTSNRFARTCLSEGITYAQQRRTFGQRLIDHQLIRHKITEMARMVEANQAWIEQVCYEMNRSRITGEGDAMGLKMGGKLALLKVQTTKTYEFCAREASQIMGGASYLREGKGRVVERLYREVRVNAIGGGSEEVMGELAIRGLGVWDGGDKKRGSKE